MAGTHDAIHDEDRLVEFCATPRSRQEMMDFLELNDRKHFTEHYLKPLLETQKLEMTIPDKLKSRNQRYVEKVRI